MPKFLDRFCVAAENLNQILVTIGTWKNHHPCFHSTKVTQKGLKEFFRIQFFARFSEDKAHRLKRKAVNFYNIGRLIIVL